MTKLRIQKLKEIIKISVLITIIQLRGQARNPEIEPDRDVQMVPNP